MPNARRNKIGCKCNVRCYDDDDGDNAVVDDDDKRDDEVNVSFKSTNVQTFL